jgi:hypothetical protein
MLMLKWKLLLWLWLLLNVVGLRLLWCVRECLLMLLRLLRRRSQTR